MSRLRTRPPTGQVPWPLLLVEGSEKAGKSYAAYRLSADLRVGRTFVIDLGEGTADEYARLGPYEVIVHDGTYNDILEQLRAACAEPTEPGKPNVVIIDSATALWSLLKSWAEQRAKRSKAGRKKLQDDPDAEVDVSMNLWNDAAERWYRVLNELRRSNVIGILIAQGKEVAKVQGGQPVVGQTDYKVEAHKGTPFAVTAQVRMTKPHTATLVAVRSLDVEVPARGLKLADENPIGHLVFDVLGAGAESAPAQIVHGEVGMSVADAKHRLLAALSARNVPGAMDLARQVWDQHGPKGTDEVSGAQLDTVIDAAEAMAANAGATT